MDVEGAKKRKRDMGQNAGANAAAPRIRRPSRGAGLNRLLEPVPHEHVRRAGSALVVHKVLGGRMLMLGLLMMITLTAHNLPEGIAVAVGTMASQRTGVVITTAIAMHNIPEGLAIAVPIYG